MSEQAIYQVVVMEPSSNAVNDLLKMLVEKNKVEISRVTSADEAFQLISQHAPCMMICSIIDSTNIPPTVTLLKRVEKLSKHGILKTMVVSKLKAPNLAALITSLNVTDYITEPVPARTVYFKSNLQLKALELAKKQQEQKKASQQQIVIKSMAGKEGADQRQDSTRAHKTLPALEIDEDTFLFKNSAVRKNGKKSIFELDGPAPDSGEWIKSEESENSWRWEEFDKKDTPEVKNGDGWTHEGEKPVFSETSKKWQFVSEKPSLAYKKNKKKVASKVTTEKNGEISIAADSEKAERNIKTSEVKAKKRRERGKPLEDATTETSEKVLKTKAIDEASPVLNEELESADPEVRKVRAEKHRRKKLGAQGEDGSTEEEGDSDGEEEKSPLARMKSRKNKKKIAGAEALPEEEEEGDLTEEELRAMPGLAEGKPKQLAALKYLNKNKEAQTHDEKKTPSLKERDRKLKELEEKEEELEEEEFEKLLEEALPSDAEPDQKEAFKKVAREKRKKRENKKSSLKLNLEENEDDEYVDNPALSLVENNANRKRAKANRVKAQKKKLIQEIQKVINEPEDGEISPAEELEIRKELGLSPTEPVSAKALKKRNKLAKVKRLKEKLQEANDELEAESLPDDINPETAAALEEGSFEKGRGGQLEQKRRKINALDTLIEEAPEEEDSFHGKLDSKKGASAKNGSKDKYFFKDETEITPIGGRWKVVDDYFIFLAKNVDFENLANLESLLPLWIFKGKKMPEFNPLQKGWRFLNEEPIQTKAVSALPIAIRDFLLKKMAGEEETADTSADGNSESEDLDSKGENLGDSETTNETSEASDSKEATAGRSSRKNRRDSSDDPSKGGREDSLENSLDNANKSDRDASRERALDNSDRSNRENTLENSAKSDRENSPENSLDDSNKANREASREKSEENSDRSESENSLEDSTKGGHENSLESEREDSNRSDRKISLDTSNRSDRKISLDTSGRSKREISLEDSGRSKLDEPMSSNEAIRRFFERRKTKVPNENQRDKIKDLSNPDADKNPYLGIFVTFSDAFADIRPSWLIFAPRILDTIAWSMGDCSVYILDPIGNADEYRILASAKPELDPNATILRIAPTGFKKEIIGQAGNILGHLYLDFVGARQSFHEHEVHTLEKAAALFAKLMEKNLLDSKAAA